MSRCAARPATRAGRVLDEPLLEQLPTSSGDVPRGKAELAGTSGLVDASVVEKQTGPQEPPSARAPLCEAPQQRRRPTAARAGDDPSARGNPLESVVELRHGAAQRGVRRTGRSLSEYMIMPCSPIML